jgi:hypothetical protein
VPDEVCKGLDRLAAYEYRQPALDDEIAAGTAPKLIDVEILGHIFEQSIGDLEQLHQEIAKARAGEGGPVGAEEGMASRRQDELTPLSPYFPQRWRLCGSFGYNYVGSGMNRLVKHAGGDP